MKGFIYINAKNIPIEDNAEGAIDTTKAFVSIKMCFLTIASLTGVAKKLLITRLISMNVTPNQIVHPATTTLHTMLTKTKLNASLVLAFEISRLGRKLAIISGKMLKADIVI